MKIVILSVIIICGSILTCYVVSETHDKELNSAEDTWLCDDDPRDYLTLCEDWQKEDCLEWAFGEDWKYLQWTYRDDKFRELHPEYDANDFADYTEMDLFWVRLESMYLSKDKVIQWHLDIALEDIVLGENP